MRQVTQFVEPDRAVYIVAQDRFTGFDVTSQQACDRFSKQFEEASKQAGSLSVRRILIEIQDDGANIPAIVERRSTIARKTRRFTYQVPATLL